MKKLLISALALSVAPQAFSATFTNQADFLDFVDSDFYLETFDSVNFGTPNPSTFTDGTYSFDADSTNGDFYPLFNAGGPGDTWLSVFGGGQNLFFSNFSSNVTAVGGYFFGTDIAGNPFSTTVTATLANGDQLQTATSSSTNFFGFSSETPIVSLTAVTPGNNFITANDFIVGTAIPEPTALVVGMIGLAGIAGRRRRKA